MNNIKIKSLRKQIAAWLKKNHYPATAFISKQKDNLIYVDFDKGTISEQGLKKVQTAIDKGIKSVGIKVECRVNWV